jgi:hypothetical protein
MFASASRRNGGLENWLQGLRDWQVSHGRCRLQAAVLMRAHRNEAGFEVYVGNAKE